MTKLSKLISNSRAMEVFAAASLMINEFNNGDWTSSPKLTSIFDELKPLNLSLEKSINQETATSNLELKDEARDERVQDIYYSVKGYTRNPDASIKEGAQKVVKIIDRFGLEIINENYAVESGFVRSLLNDLSVDGIQASIDAMPGARELVTALKTAEDEFEAARVAYDKAAADDKEKVSATALKKQVLAVVNEKLVLFLKTMCTLGEEETYGEFTKLIAKIIDDNNETVKKRQNKEDPGAGE